MSPIKHIFVVALITIFTTSCGENKSNNASAPQAEGAAVKQEAVDPAKLYFEAVSLRDGTDGKTVDKEKALAIFKQLADMGDSNAMFFVGVMYENGESVPVDQNKALEWLEKSAKAGNGAAPERIKQLKAKMKKK